MQLHALLQVLPVLLSREIQFLLLLVQKLQQALTRVAMSTSLSQSSSTPVDAGRTP